MRDVEKDLDERCAFVGEHSLELPDVRGSPFPDVPGRKLSDADGDDILVVRAVKDADFAVLRTGRVDPPEVVVCELGTRRRLERMDAAPLRIHSPKDVVDRSVLPRGIES